MTLPDTFNMARYCLGVCDVRPADKVALLVYDDLNAEGPSEVWTYGRLEDVVLRIAAALQDAGLERGQSIALRLQNTSSYALMFFGAIAGGFVPLPMSSQLTAEEASFLIRDSEAVGVALDDGLPVEPEVLKQKGLRIFSQDDVQRMCAHARRASFASTRKDDPAYLIYTSGTTANPKGVLHAQRAAFGRRPMYEGWYGLRADDRMLHAGAFNWTYTLGTGLIDPWAVGATSIIFTGDKHPDVWPRLIAKAEATIFAAVPGLFRQILKYAPPSPGSLPSLRHGLIAGEAPPATLFDDWEAASGTKLYEAIGMSEISTYISSGPSTPRRAGTIGKAQPGRRVAVLPVDEGEEPLPANTEGLLAVHRSDPGLMLGYWKRPVEQADVLRGEWFVGGDLAKIDDDGYVTHLGRANDIMKALGYRVSPQEVEAALAKHPSVAEVACAELEVREDVSVVAAYVVLNAGARGDVSELEAFAKEHLADYKRPREYRFVEQLPRTANGKVRRASLADL